MKILDKENARAIRMRFAAALYKALKSSSFKSYRQLAKEAGLEHSHMQKISTGSKDITLTTTMAIANAFKMKYAELAAYYDSLTANEMEEFIEYLEKQKRLRGKEKVPGGIKNSKKLK